MPEQLQFRYVSLAVGSFLLAILLILVVVIFEAARIQQWFHSEVRLTVRLPAAGSFGLEDGSAVVLLGTDVGRIRHIRVTPDGDMFADIAIDAAYMPFVRADSTVYIKKRFGVAGDAFLEMSRGVGAELDPLQPMLTAKADESPTELLQVVMEEVRSELVPMVRDAHTGVLAWTELSHTLEQSIGEMHALLMTLGSVVGRLERGEGSLGKLLTEDQLVRDLGRTTVEMSTLIGRAGPVLDATGPMLDELRHTTLELHGLLSDLHAATVTLPATAKSVDRVATNLPALVLETEATLRETQRFLQRLQNHWLFGGGSAPTPDPAARIPAEEALP